MKTGSVEALIQTTDHSVIYQCDRMELWTLRMMILLISFIHVGQAQEIKPVLTVQPNAPQIFRGETVTLSCIISGCSEQYIWYKDGVHVHRSAEKDYTIKVDQSHRYSCYGSKNGQTTAWSDEVTLSVIERPKAVVILQSDGEIFSGQKVTLSCEIQGPADTVDVEWMYNWYKDGILLFAPVEHKYYSFTAVKSFSGKFSCRGQTKSDSQTSETSPAVTLTVSEKPKPELTSDRKGAALTGNPVTLYCTLTPQSAGWKFYWIKPTQSSETETETHQYIISSVRVSDGGQYRCRAGRGNPVYYTDYSDELWVNVIERPKAVVTIKPDTHVFRGETVTLRCEIKGGRKTDWIYRWYKDDQIYRDHKTQEFSLNSVRNEHSGKYTCRGRRRSDSQSSEISDAVTLTVSDGDVILDSPVHPVTEGHNLTLRCLFHNKKIPGSGVDFYKDDSILHSQTTGEMTISSVSMSDEGFYHCKHPERGESLKSWVSVRGRSHVGASMSVLRLISSLVTVSVYLLLTIILAVKCFRARVQTDEDTQNAVIEE